MSRAKLPLRDAPTDSADGCGAQNCCTQKGYAVADHPGGGGLAWQSLAVVAAVVRLCDVPLNLIREQVLSADCPIRPRFLEEDIE